MKRLFIALVGGLLVSGSMAVFADEEAKSPHSFSGGATLSTDYMFRGQSQTGNNPAVSGTFNYNYSGEPVNIYLGTWASNINFGGNLELDWYGGVTGDLGGTGIGYDVGFLYYQYPGKGAGTDLDYVEGSIGLSYGFSDLPGSPNVGFKAHFSPDWQTGAGDATYLEGNVSFTLPYDFGLAVHVGHQSIDKNAIWGTPDWTEWNVYLSRNIGPFAVSVGYQDTDLSKAQCFGGTNICEGRAVANVGMSF